MRHVLCACLLASVLCGCGGDDDPAGPGTPGNIPDALRDTYGDYSITCTTSVSKDGGPFVPVGAAKRAADLEIRASQPGVMGVDPGQTVPGVDPGDVIFGAAYVQNPVHVFVGTTTADQDGDFGLWSSVWFGVPDDAVNLQFDGCEGQGVFNCSPRFFESATSSDAVNLVYHAVSVTQQADGGVLFEGTLIDDHRSEASAANGFSIDAVHDILGPMVDLYLYDEGASFSFLVRDGAVTGSIDGHGRSIIGSTPDHPRFRVTFGGEKLR